MSMSPLSTHLPLMVECSISRFAGTPQLREWKQARVELRAKSSLKRKLLAAGVRVSKPSLSVFQNLLLSGCGDTLSLCPGLTGESVFMRCECVGQCVFVSVYVREGSPDHKGVFPPCSQSWNVLALDGSNWQRIDLFDFQRDIEVSHSDPTALDPCA